VRQRRRAGLLAREGSARHQMWLQNQFTTTSGTSRPAIRATAGPTTSTSGRPALGVGAFHAAALVCRFPDVFTRALAMSGPTTCGASTTRTTRVLGRILGVVAAHFVRPRGRHLEVLRSRFVLIASGEGRAEDIGESWNLANVLGRHGIPNRVDSWGGIGTTIGDMRRMLPQILDAWTRAHSWMKR